MCYSPTLTLTMARKSKSELRILATTWGAKGARRPSLHPQPRAERPGTMPVLTSGHLGQLITLCSYFLQLTASEILLGPKGMDAGYASHLSFIGTTHKEAQAGPGSILDVLRQEIHSIKYPEGVPEGKGQVPHGCTAWPCSLLYLTCALALRGWVGVGGGQAIGRREEGPLAQF